MLKIIKLILFFIFFYISVISINSLVNGNLHLSWPDQVLIAPILKLKGLLINDFHTNGYIETPIINLVNIFKYFTPNEQDKIISSFANFTIIHKSLYIVFSLYLISTYSLLLSSKKQKHNIETIRNKHLIVFITLNIFYSIIQINPFSYYLNDIFFGSRIASLNFFDDGNHARQIALFLAIFSVSIPFTFELYRFKLNNLKKFFTIFVSLLLFIFAIYIHPVSPLFIIPLTFFLPIILSSKKYLILNWAKYSFIMFSIWLFYSLSLLKSFPQEFIENELFFKIHIQERHPHHFFASEYLNSKHALLFLLINLIIISFLIFFKYRYKLNSDFPIKNISVGLILFLIIHLIQFTTVDILKLKSFMKLGISSLTILFNFYYVSTIVIFCINLLDKSDQNIFSSNKLIIKRLSFSSFNILLFLFTIITIILLRITYNFNMTYVENSLERKISEIAISNNIDSKYEYIISEELKPKLLKMREFGLLNIYSDKYFPFNTKYFSDWYQRKNNLSTFEKCLNDINSSNCKIDKQNIIYISSKENKNIGLPIVKKNINYKKLGIACRIKKDCSKSQKLVFILLRSQVGK